MSITTSLFLFPETRDNTQFRNSHQWRDLRPSQPCGTPRVYEDDEGGGRRSPGPRDGTLGKCWPCCEPFVFRSALMHPPCSVRMDRIITDRLTATQHALRPVTPWALPCPTMQSPTCVVWRVPLFMLTTSGLRVRVFCSSKLPGRLRVRGR